MMLESTRRVDSENHVFPSHTVGQPAVVGVALKLRDIGPLEAPFGWKKDLYNQTKIRFWPFKMNPTISFSAKPYSKILGYLPIVGTIVGIYRLYRAYNEYRFFNETHLHDLSNRSIKWAIRGGIELVPVLGGVICLITDIVTTLCKKMEILNFKDETNCRKCHTCIPRDPECHCVLV